MRVGYPSREEPDIEFHAKRAQQERALAAAADDPAIKHAHLELALMHEQSAASLPRKLHLVRDA